MSELTILFFLVFIALCFIRGIGGKNKICRRFSVWSIYLLVSFFVLHVFMLTWEFRQDHGRFGFHQMTSFTAHRPFVYRALVPFIVNLTSSFVPEGVVRSNEKRLTEDSPAAGYVRLEKWGNPGLWDARLSLKYHLTYVLLFLCLVSLIFSMRYLTRLVYDKGPPIYSDLCPAVALLLLPLTFSEGGYFYDFPELLFMGLSLICLIRRRWILYYIVFSLALLNKESSILLILFFMAFYGNRVSRKDYLKHLTAHILIGAAVIISVRGVFITFPVPQPGVIIGNGLKENIRIFLSPASYFQFFDPYHLGAPVFPKGLNVLSILAVSFLVFYGWKKKPLNIRRLFIFTSAVLLPIYLYAGYAPEVRALSLVFPSAYLLGFHTVYFSFLKKIHAE